MTQLRKKSLLLCYQQSLCLLLLTCLLFNCFTAAKSQISPERIEQATINRIKNEELKNSQIMETVGYLTDVIGPRLTGSPRLKKAQEYAKSKLQEWGMGNAHLEQWGPFGRGWSLEGFTAKMTAPDFSNLIAYPKAWSPATAGAIRGEVVFMDVKTQSDLNKYKGKLKGKIVLLSPARPVEPLFLSTPNRTTDAELEKLAAAKLPESE